MRGALIFVFMPVKRSDELHLLIRSMGKAEKRFFRQIAGITGGNKSYVRLFNVIERMREHDEARLKKQFRNLPAEKQYLQKQVLYSLRISSDDGTLAPLLESRIAEIRVLMNKRLFSLCRRLLDKTIRLAHEHEMFAYLFILYREDQKLAIRSGDYPRLYALLTERVPLIHKAAVSQYTEDELGGLSNRIFSIISTTGNVGGKGRGELGELVKKCRAVFRKGELSLVARCYYFQALSMYYYHVSDSERALQINTLALEMFRDNPHRIPYQLPTYWAFLKNQYNRAYALGKLTQCRETQQQIEDLQKNWGRQLSESLRLEVECSLFEIRVELLCTDGDHSAALALCRQTEGFMQKNRLRLRVQNHLFFHLFYTICLFRMNEIKAALVHVNLILNDRSLNVRHDMVLFAHLLNLMIHYELGNIDLIRTAAGAMQSYNRKSKLGFRSPAVLYTFFTGLMRHYGDRLKCRKLAESAHHDLRPLFSDYDEKRMLVITGFLDWLKVMRA